MQETGNLISNDPLVAAIFSALAKIPSDPFDKLRAITRAGKIAEAYLPPNHTKDSGQSVIKALGIEPQDCSVPSEPQFAHS
jgi:hypothetical protein